MEARSKILIVGGSGYIGKYMVKASVSMGHPTHIYVRPKADIISSPSRLDLLEEFQSMGVQTSEGHLNEHEKLVSAIKQVDIVISALAIPQHEEQYKLMEAIKEAGNIKRFVPSEFGCETDRTCALPPFQAIIEKRKKIRRAVEASGIPYTFITANCYATYFIDVLLHPQDQTPQVVVYGTGEAKGLPYPENAKISVIHDLFIKGHLLTFELGDDFLDVTELFPDYTHTSIHELLDACAVHPPKLKHAAF